MNDRPADKQITMHFTRFLYDAAVRGYGWGIRVAAMFNTKAAQWVEGRKHWRIQAEKQLPPKGDRCRIWVHCASLGEFEQGRPLIEAVHARHPEAAIILTFFSPSGYEVRKHYTGADCVLYLPLDTRANAEDLVNMICPSLVVFVKYEFWYHYLTVLYKRQIPMLLVAAIFRKEQVFFAWYGGFFRQLLSYYEQIFVQDNASFELLRQTGLKNITLSGDTRFDRVYAIAQAAPAYAEIEDFLKGSGAFVAGSTWPPDEQLLSGFFRENSLPFKWIVAPHEIGEKHLAEVEELFGKENVLRYSALRKDKGDTGCRVLLIDNIGMLSGLYRYGMAAYVGGGFGRGIHNILEPAVFGMPVLFGPAYKKFREAHDLLKSGAAFSVKNSEELNAVMQRHVLDVEAQRSAAREAAAYVKDHLGATGQIIGYIAEKRFLIRE